MIVPHPTGSITISIRKEWQYNCEINTHSALPMSLAYNPQAHEPLFGAMSGRPQLVVEG